MVLAFAPALAPNTETEPVFNFLFPPFALTRVVAPQLAAEALQKSAA